MSKASEFPEGIVRRIQVEFQDKHEAQYFMDVFNECGFRSKAEFFNNAVALMAWIAEKINQGQRIGSFNPETGEKTEYGTPFIQHLVAKCASRKDADLRKSRTSGIPVSNLK